MKKRIICALVAFIGGFLGDLTQQLLLGLRETPNFLLCAVTGIIFATITWIVSTIRKEG